MAEELLRVMEFSTEGGRLIPEQVWDAADIPARELFTGKPTFAACPLVWAHSEYIKLRRSLRDGRIFDQPPNPFSVMWSRRRNHPTMVGASTTNAEQCHKARLCGFRCLRLHWCIGALTAGARFTRPKPWTQDSASTPPTCRQHA